MDPSSSNNDYIFGGFLSAAKTVGNKLLGLAKKGGTKVVKHLTSEKAKEKAREFAIDQLKNAGEKITEAAIDKIASKGIDNVKDVIFKRADPLDFERNDPIGFQRNDPLNFQRG